MALFGLFGGNTASSASNPESTGYTGAGPPITTSIAATGKGSTVSATTNNVSTSNLDLSKNTGNPVLLSNVSVGGPLVLTDPGAIAFGSHAIDVASEVTGKSLSTAADLIAGGVGSALKLADNALTGALKSKDEDLRFASGLSKGYADTIQAAVQQNYGAIRETFDKSLHLVEGTISGLGNSLSSAVETIAKQNRDALNFFGQETAQLQGATVKAIDTVALRTSSESAQGLAGLQSTFIKVAAGMGAVIVVISYFMSRK